MSDPARELTTERKTMNDKKLKEVFDSVSEDYKTVVLLTEGGGHQGVAVKGKAVDLLYMTRELVISLREAMRNEFGAECTEELLKTVLLTRDEMKEKVEEKAKSIPSWLKRLMNVEDEDDDDAEDEPCCCCDDSDEDEDDDAYSRVCPETAEEKARRKAIEQLIDALRGGISGHGNFDLSLRSK